jgi:hypothetical protein
MTTTNKSDLALNEFISTWEQSYKQEQAQIPLFQPETGKNLSTEQKQKFVKQFYHIRGHFYEMLWFLGSLAPSFEYKKVVLQNITEEFGGKKSHENLYWDFATELGVDIQSEILSQTNNLKYIQDFDFSHKNWVITQKWEAVWGALSAYEKLDSVDYRKLLILASELNISEKGLHFFVIHAQAQHFETTENLLQKCWDSDSEAVIAGFEFIKEAQMKVWKGLSEEVLRG